jgi:hypothetical protein
MSKLSLILFQNQCILSMDIIKFKLEARRIDSIVKALILWVSVAEVIPWTHQFLAVWNENDLSESHFFYLQNGK